MILQFQLGRGIVWLKRIALALERIANSQEGLVSVERQRTPQRKKPQPTEVFTASVTDWNKQYREAHPELYDET